jgi:spore maturation protein CgeB
MRFAVFGLTISSSWGNGHATPWRGLCRALASRGHAVTFFERDVPYYAAHRDAPAPEGCDLRLYNDWNDIVGDAQRAVDACDVAMVTSYCPDAQAATNVVLDSHADLKVFYDMDAPMTLDAIERGMPVEYLPREGLGPFDLVLSFTGGRTLDALQTRLGARAVAPLYGSVDPIAHRPVNVGGARRFDLTYLGTYAPERQHTLDELFIEPARRRTEQQFAIAGSQYPAQGFPWQPNIFYLRHLPPPEHPAFYSASYLTLNVTRAPMAAMGFCPPGRLFEAAACGTPVVTDCWEGLETFFEPGREILVARDADDVTAALDLDSDERRQIGRRARERALSQHSAQVRAGELVKIVRDYVGDRSGGRSGQPHAAAGVFQRTAAGRQPS